ncbi:MAG: methyltransferase domain-containing protein [Xanthobacteraceae bacterium]|nr:methyltransferase domain-containing protein [Xanthobacteraceae bacterium]
MSGAPLIFDRKLLRIRQQRARKLEPVTFLTEQVAQDLAERLRAVVRAFPLAVDLGSPGDTVPHELAEEPAIERLVAVKASAAEPGCTVVADEELPPFADASIDLAVSVLALHTVNDLPGTLVQIRRALKPDGLFLAALLGGDTLTELRQSFALAEAEIMGGVSPHVAPFGDVRELGALLQRAGFALPVADVDRVTVRYSSVFSLMHDLRGMGATNVLLERRRQPLRRTTLLRMAQLYAEKFADPDGKLRATFDIVWLSGWVPHPSQQQPLRPGSARTRLADALGVVELPAGDKTGR